MGAVIGFLSRNNRMLKGELVRMSHEADVSAREESDDSSGGSPDDDSRPDTAANMLRALRGIGCQPVPEEDEEDAMNVQYQGEKFYIECGGPYARIWDPAWAQIKTDDPEYPIVREAINATNFSFGPTVVMTRPNDEGIVTIHSRRDIMLHPALPEHEQYVKAVLDSFFEIKGVLRQRLQDLRTSQTNATIPANPGGFSVN